MYCSREPRFPRPPPLAFPITQIRRHCLSRCCSEPVRFFAVFSLTHTHTQVMPRLIVVPPSFRKSTKPASESRGRWTTWGPKSVTSKSSHCTRRCPRNSSRGSLSRPHLINQMVPLEGRYKCLAAIKTYSEGEVEAGSLKERASGTRN